MTTIEKMLVNTENVQLESNIRPRGGLSGQFPRGYLFGQPSRIDLANAKQDTRKNAHYEEKHGMATHWSAHSTPLERYAQPIDRNDYVPTRPNVRTFLLRRTDEARTLGKILRVLDVGVGTGDQWTELIRGGNMEFHATSLTSVGIRVGIMKHTTTCTAAGLYKNFPPDYFDVVVAHYGTHHTQKSGLENMLWVARPGGEIMVSGEGELPPIAKPENFRLFYRIIDSDIYRADKKEDAWFYMIRKEFMSMEKK